MSLILPTIEEVKRHIKSELRRIQARGYSVEDIHACIKEYCDRAKDYELLIQQFSTHVQSAPSIAPHVHSVRFRLKDPLHLADKLVRKCLAKERPRNITPNTFFSAVDGVTDLGAVRILHLRRDEWRQLHDYFMAPAKLKGMSIVEKTAHIKPGKPDEYIAAGRFEKSEIKSDVESGYTSLHYIFKSSNGLHGELLFECQVRTLFEEGWGELDHQSNYPYKANSILRGYLSNLNSTAQTANEIASKLDTLTHIPLFVPWNTELQLERSADRVFCVTPDLKWVANNLDAFVAHVKDSGGTFHYFVLKDDTDANDNFERTKNRLQSEGLWGTKVSINRVDAGKSIVPVIADLLLLENASDPVSRKERHLSVVGAPAQRNVSHEEHLDMLITEESAVDRMQKFFANLQS